MTSIVKPPVPEPVNPQVPQTPVNLPPPPGRGTPKVPSTVPPGTGGYFPATSTGAKATPGVTLGATANSGATSPTTFSATNNLIGSQFNPTPSAQTQQAGTLTSNAANTYAQSQPAPFRSIAPLNTTGVSGQFQGAADLYNQQSAFGYQAVGPTDQSGTRSYLDQAMPYATGSDAARSMAGAGGVGGFGYSGDTSSARGASSAQLDALLNNTPDRAQLANDTYNLMLERAQPGEKAEDRRLAQQTAALGRVGSGMFNSSQMDLATQRELTRDQARRELATNAAQQSLSDQYNKLQAAQGLAGDMASWDLGAGGLNAQYAQMGLNERDAAFRRLSGLDQNAFNNLTNMAGFEYGMARDARGDALGERDAQRTAQLDSNDVLRSRGDATRQLGLDQYGLQSDAYNRDLRERDAEQAYDQTRFDRARSQFGDMANWQGQRETEDRNQRNEMRGERDYQYGLERDAQGDRINQWLMEQDAQNNDFNRAMEMARFGYGTNPSGAYTQAGQQASQNAGVSQAGAAELLAMYGQNRQRRQPPPATGGGYLVNDAGVYG